MSGEEKKEEGCFVMVKGVPEDCVKAKFGVFDMCMLRDKCGNAGNVQDYCCGDRFCEYGADLIFKVKT